MAAQRDKTNFLIFAAGAIGMILAAVGFAAVNAKPTADQAAPAVEGAVEAAATSNNIIALEVGALAIAIILGVFAITILICSLGWQQIKHERSFDLLILLGTLVLPQLTAFPMKIIGWNPLDYELPGLLKPVRCCSLCWSSPLELVSYGRSEYGSLMPSCFTAFSLCYIPLFS